MRLHAGLVVIEHDVVGVARGLEAGHVLAAQLEVAFEVRQQDGEVLRLAGAQPALVPLRAGAGHLGAQLRRDEDGFLVVAARDPDQVGERAQLLEELAEIGRDVELMGDPVQRRALLGPRLGPARRHLRLFVPGEDRRGFLQVVDLGETLGEILKTIGQGVRA